MVYLNSYHNIGSALEIHVGPVTTGTFFFIFYSLDRNASGSYLPGKKGLFKLQCDKYSDLARNTSHICVDTQHRIYADTIQVYNSAAGDPESLQ